MRKLLFESVCFVVSMAYAPIMAFRFPRADERFGMMMSLAAVSVFAAAIVLVVAFLKQDPASEPSPT